MAGEKIRAGRRQPVRRRAGLAADRLRGLDRRPRDRRRRPAPGARSGHGSSIGQPEHGPRADPRRSRSATRSTAAAASATRAACSASASASTCTSSPPPAGRCATSRPASPRCHLDIDDVVVSPYASGLACLVEDEMDLGVTLIDMGGGTTTHRRLLRRRADPHRQRPGRRQPRDQRHRARPVDAARPCRAPEDAVRQRHRRRRATSARSSTVPLIGEEDDGRRRARCRDRCWSASSARASRRRSSWCARGWRPAASTRLAGRRVVLTGGASQLPGVRELAGADPRQAGPHRPAASDLTGLRRGDQRPGLHDLRGPAAPTRVSSTGGRRHGRRRTTEVPAGRFGRIGQWLTENF